MLVTRNKTTFGLRLVAQSIALILAIGGGATLAVTVSPSSARAEDSQGFSGAPADGDHSDPTRTRFSFTAEPGQIINDSLYLENTGTETQDITVYSTDAYNAEDGTFSLLDGGIAPTDVGSWVSFESGARQVVTLAPQSSTVVGVTISIPANANPGDHVGGILASVSGADGQVKLERRVATRLYVRVGGDLQPGLTVGGLAASYQPNLNPFDGKVVFTYTVQNTGNVALSGKSVSSISGLFGMGLSGVIRNEIPELLPGGAYEMTSEVPGVWQWIWMNSKLSLVGVDSSGSSAALGAMPTATREASTWAVPWGLLVLLIAAGFVLVYIRFSRMNNERRSQQWMEYTEAEARLRAREESPES
jgi:hypothetical protein